MALTDEQVAALRDLGQLGSKILNLKETLEKVSRQIAQLQSKRTSLVDTLQSVQQDFQDQWEVLKQ